MDEPEVSRETRLPPAPDEARGACADDRWPLLTAYAEDLASDGVVRGLIGPREVPRLWERHVLNCAAMVDLVPTGARLCDVGSGAGLPGLVIAIVRPDVSVTLVEPVLRRTTFLTEVVERHALSNVVVHRGRADSLHGVETYDVVTSRAVAPLTRLLEWSMPLVAPSGRLVAMKGSSVVDEITDAADVLRVWGCAPPEVSEVSAPGASPTQVVQVAWSDPATVSWPRARPSRSQQVPGRGSPRMKRRPGKG